MYSAQRGNVGLGNHKRRKVTGRCIAHLIWLTLLLSILGSATVSLAADISLFGPKRYERTQGKPPLYTETFTGCSATGAQAVIRIQNGSSKASSLSSAVVSLNGSSVFSESDFKKQTPWLEKIVSFRPGSNTLTVELKSGGQQETPFLIINVLGRGCDVTPPIITTPQPAEGALLNIAQPGISASYADNPGGTGIDPSSVRVTLDSGDITSSCTAGLAGVSCLPSSNLAEGGHTVSVVVSDLSNNSASLDWRFATDTIAPALAVTSPADGFLTRNHQLTVTGTFSEPLTSLAVNGQTVTVDAMAFTTTVTLTEGANNIILEATDRAGNKGAVTFNVTLDSTPPTAPALEALTTPVNSPIVVVKGSAEPWSNVGLSAGGVQLANTTADAAGLFSFAGLTLTEGETIFTAQATDLAGNAGQPSAPLAITLDTKAPLVSVTVPLDKAILNTRVVTVIGSIDDPTAAVTINSLPALNSGGVWTLEGFTLQEGSNALLVEARDPAGNKGSATAAVILDTVPPAISVATPVDGLYTNIPLVTVTGTVNEDVASVTINGVTASVSTTSSASTTFTATLTLIEGANTLVVTAVDRAGNSTSSTVTATLDTVAPQLTVIGPADGALLNNGQITFGGAATEPVVSVLVNGIAAQVGTSGGYTLPITLAEGSNTLTVTAIDRAGNSSTNTITVNLDSIAPAAPLLNAQVTPTRIAISTVAGQAEANSTVTLFNNGVTVGTLKADAAGSFSVADVTLTEGTNIFTAQAADAAGNTSPPTAPLSLVLDTKAPVITVTTPQTGALVSAAQVTISGMVDEPLVSLTVNGASTPLSAGSSDPLTFEYVLALTAGENSALITATDLAGNVATTTVTIQRDSTPPKVVIVTPLNGLLTNTSQIQISGTVDDADAIVTVGGALVSVVNKAFSVGYLLSDGDNSIQVKGVDKAGNEGMATVTVALDAQSPVVTLAAPATAAAGTDVQITLNAEDNRNLTLVDLSADGASLWSAVPSATTASQSVSLRLPPTLAPGVTVTLRARALDAAGNSGSATTVITIDKGADGPGWLQGKVLDDNRGLPLEGARVSVSDSKGQQQNITTPADGSWFFELASGAAKVEAVKDGYTTVRRDVTVRPGQRTRVLDSRLTKIDGTVTTVDATGGAVKSAPFKIQNSSFTIDLSIPAAALAAPTDVRLTPLSNQGLIAPLPPGWSPLAAADVRMLDPVTAAVIEPLPLTAAAAITFPLPKGLGDNALTAQLARYDNSSRSWLAAAEVAITAKSPTASASISQPGQYALVLADPAPLNPPAPAAGQELAALTIQPSDFSLISTTGRVVPQAAIPSVGLRAAGDLLLVAKVDAATTPALISGLVVSARVTEKFDLTGGDKLQPAPTLQDLVLYRTPCATAIAGGSTEPFDPAAGLRTTFPVSPSRDFTIVDLLLGKISIEISPPDTSGGVMVGADGARLLQPDGTALNIPAGALSGTAPVTVATLPGASVSALVGADFRLLRGVDIAIGGQSLKIGATLSIPVPSGFDPALPVVVAKKFDVKGGSRLKLVAAGTVTGSIISSTAAITAGNETLPAQGITTSGQYLFLQATSPIGYVTGQVTDAAAAPFAAIQVSARNATLADQTSANGIYLLALAAAVQDVTALDPTRGDAASGSVTIGANTRNTLNLTVRMVPPTVAAITPANGATNVQTDVAVTVTFSKPMDKSTVTNDTFILRDASSVIPGVITWNAEATVATFYPAEAFKQETVYSVTIAAMVKDLQGYSLGQNVSSSFTVRRTTPPAMPAAGAVSGTFPDVDGFITVTGTQGSAEAGNTVLLINDTTGEIQSVTPASNGSFTGKVRGQLGDQIKVVLMDYSGNQTTISYLTFKGPDGSYLVTAKGGKVEGEGGSILDIPEGALVGPTVLKVTALPEANLPTPLQAPGTFLSAFNIDTGGIGFQKEVHLSIPVPPGFNTNTPVFVTRPSEVYNADGTIETVYEIVDSTKVLNGRITTASPPFDGIMTLGSYAFTAFPEVNIGIVSGYTYQDMNDMPGYQPIPDGSVDTPILDAAGNPTYKFDRPIQGAVIRTPTAWNYVSYSKSSGFYAGFTTLYGNVGAPELEYRLTAIHPQTMQRENVTAYLSADGAASYNIKNINFKLADKTTIQPDKTAPVIDMALKVVSGQSPENRISSGVMPLGTELAIPLSIIDQSSITATMTVVYQSSDLASTATSSAIVTLQGRTLVSAQTSDKPAIWRNNYQPTFSADLKGSQPFYFKPQTPGIYKITVEATDASLIKNAQSLQVRVVTAGTIPGGMDGPPTVDLVTPYNGEKDLLVSTQVTAWFSEPVDNVTGNTFKLIDSTTGLQVSAAISATFEGGRMRADLTPRGNLAYDRSYQVLITSGISDVTPNPSSGDTTLPLAQAYQSTFTTKRPSAYDLASTDQFSGGRDIALFNDINNGSSYTYVAAGDKGWRVVDVSNQNAPEVVHTTSSSCVPGVSTDCTAISPVFNFRGVAVHPDPNRALLTMTENIAFADGNQYGYIRFYDLAANPINPPRVGQEKLAEAYSGIPGRVAMWGDYAYVATAAAALQVVSISTAIDNVTNHLPTNEGTSIVGAFDSIGQGYGSPNDIVVYGPGKALLTTNPGHLLVLDINNPVPVLMGLIEPANLRAFRVAGTTDYVYPDSDGNPQVMDLAVAGGNGRIKTVDLSDPYNPRVLATVKDSNGIEVVSYPFDITLNKAAGLALVTTLNAIQVVDVKDPNNPRLLNTITQLPDTSGVATPSGTPAMLPIGSIPAMVENNGWLFMADENKGMRTLELGGEEKRGCSPINPCDP